jgi:hypothetical protein
MTNAVEIGVAKIGIRLIDDAHIAWVAAESDSEQALRAWFDRPFRRNDLYYVYRAALDREEAAALDLQRLAELAEDCRDVLGGHNTDADSRTS